MMDKTLSLFLQHQKEAEERFDKREEERWKREVELEERRRKADEEHEYMMQLLLRGPHSYQQSPNQYDYINDTY